MNSIKFLGALVVCCASAAQAASLTDIWTDPHAPGVRAVLVQRGDSLSIDLHQQMSIDGVSLHHAPALKRIGLDASGHPVFAGALADGSGFVSVQSTATGGIVVEIEGIPMPRAFQFARADSAVLDLGGSWLGGYSHGGAPCPQFSGPARERAGNWQVFYPDDEDATRVTLRFASTAQVCHFNGKQAALGSLTRIDGEYTCTGGLAGVFESADIELGGVTLGGTMKLRTVSCGDLRLRFGGVRRNGF